MQAPTIKVDGKSFTARKPKAKIWRKVVAFNRGYSQVDDLHSNEEAYEAMITLIADCFNSDAITPEVVEDNLDIDEMIPKLAEVTAWVAHLVAGKSAQVPSKNAQRATPQTPTNQ